LFHVDSNYIEFLECGKVGSILPVEPVHSQSKHEVVQRAPHMFAFLREQGDRFEADITVKEENDVNRKEQKMEEAATFSSPVLLTTNVAAAVIADGNESADTHEVRAGSPEASTAVTIEEQATVSSSTTTAAYPAAVAIVMGDRPPDFEVLSAFPDVLTFRVGFARGFEPEYVDPLLEAGQCDVVLVGREHGLDAVNLLIQDLLALRLQHQVVTLHAIR
jgi:hypothetical protein